MNSSVRNFNQWVKFADKEDVDYILSKVILSDRQAKVFEMFYLKRQNVGFIADTLNVCQLVINKELKIIRDKMLKILQI